MGDNKVNDDSPGIDASQNDRSKRTLFDQSLAVEKRMLQGKDKKRIEFEKAYEAMLERYQLQPHMRECGLLRTEFEIARRESPPDNRLSPEDFFNSVGPTINEARPYLEAFPDLFDRGWKSATNIIGDKFLLDTIDGKPFVDFLRSMDEYSSNDNSNLKEALKKSRVRFNEFEKAADEAETRWQVNPLNRFLPNIRRCSVMDAAKLFDSISVVQLSALPQSPIPEGSTIAKKEVTAEQVECFKAFQEYESKYAGITASYYREKIQIALGSDLGRQTSTLKEYVDRFEQEFPQKEFNKRLNAARYTLKLPQKSPLSKEQRLEFEAYMKEGAKGFNQFFESYKKRKADENSVDKSLSSIKKAFMKR
ncbi:MAG TPA: hypothetical protein VM532_18970 [Burkholderiales bacterium]|nr:hypothetical protein [Burkholderiales bacterium]